MPSSLRYNWATRSFPKTSTWRLDPQHRPERRLFLIIHARNKGHARLVLGRVRSSGVVVAWSSRPAGLDQRVLVEQWLSAVKMYFTPLWVFFANNLALRTVQARLRVYLARQFSIVIASVERSEQEK